MIYHPSFGKGNTTDANMRPGIDYPSGTSEFIPLYRGVCFAQSLVFCVVFVDHCFSFCPVSLPTAYLSFFHRCLLIGRLYLQTLLFLNIRWQIFHASSGREQVQPYQRNEVCNGQQLLTKYRVLENDENFILLLVLQCLTKIAFIMQTVWS